MFRLFLLENKTEILICYQNICYTDMRKCFSAVQGKCFISKSQTRLIECVGKTVLTERGPDEACQHKCEMYSSDKQGHR